LLIIMDRNRSVVPYGAAKQIAKREPAEMGVRSHSSFPDHAIQRHSEMMGHMMQRAN
jgi:hypothetical protein